MRTGWARHAWVVAVVITAAACSPVPDVSRHSPPPSSDTPPAPHAARTVEPPITAPAVLPPQPYEDATDVLPPAPSRTGRGTMHVVDGRAVVGDGTRQSCTAAALGRAVARGGTVTFDCGGPARIVLTEPLRVCAAGGCAPGEPSVARVRIEGGDAITLVGAGAGRLIEARGCTASEGGCTGAPVPHLVLSRLVLEGGAAPRVVEDDERLTGGGAVAMDGGRLTLDAVTFAGNTCSDPEASAGGAVLARDMVAPVRVRGAAFLGNSCGLGGALAVVDAPLRLRATTVVDNTATVAGGGLLLRSPDADVELSMAMVVGNTAPRGAAIEHETAEGALTVRDSRVEAGPLEPDAIAVRSLTD
ncbi:hypothetical protein [Demequina gelatinilytica]|uniref:hypothetical protein n=1 Tax=Demequina gelatinilytica TaxID=1638980 RepID=UPI0012E058F5|nr:hypothetical protein [Demequina gelatinilytica]